VRRCALPYALRSGRRTSFEVRSLHSRSGPDAWTAAPSSDVRDRGVDAIIKLTAPDGTVVTLVLECKRALLTRDLPALREQLKSATKAIAPTAVPVVVSRYLSPSVRNWLDDGGLSYLDVTGNLRLTSTQPALFIRDRGADRDPWRKPGRPRGTLKGVPAARVVRALVDFFPPVSAPALVQRARSSTGATYRVLEFLDEEALITRSGRGVESVMWRQLIERWSEDYGFQQSNSVSGYVQPRGISALVNQLPQAKTLTYVVTGSLAAQRLAPYAPPRLATLYVDDPVVSADVLGLRAVETGANVLLAVPKSDMVFDRSALAGGVKYAAPSQVAVDLLTGPGRAPSEAQELLDWMEENEPAWRRRPVG